MAGSLDGIRILDLTTIYSGPIAASILGDQGADVVKVESPQAISCATRACRSATASAALSP